MKIIERTHDVQLDEVIDTERTLTAEENAEIKAIAEAKEAHAKALAEKAAEKAALFAKLGITADEARLLLG